MTVPSAGFLVFAAAAALVFNLGAPAWWRRSVLLLVNLGFLAGFAASAWTLLPMAGFLVLGFAAHRVTWDGRAAPLFPAALVAVLAAFFWLKRYGFVPGAALLPFPYVLVGLSYICFRVLHLIVDGHQGALDGRVGALTYLNYTLNFTSLTSGPIQRYQDYRRQETHPPSLDLAVAGVAVERIVLGCFKVAIVSLLLALVRHRAIEGLGADATLSGRVWSGMLIAGLYPPYLYFNFSGYMDVVIGVARFFRIVLPENFDRPFAAENFIAFWSRWHITLSGWLRTYVYNPLMRSWVTRWPAPHARAFLSAAALFVTFSLVGLWHGQTSEFVVFGVLEGGGVAVNQLYQMFMLERLGRAAWRALAANPVYRACARGLTFTWFAFTLLWFWSDWTQLDRLATQLGAPALASVWLGILTAATLVLVAMQAGRACTQAAILRSRYLRTARGTALALITAVALVLLQAPPPDIVYKAF